MNKTEKHYLKCYNSEKAKALAHIKAKLVLDKKKHHTFSKSSNELIREFIEIKKSTIPAQHKYFNLYSIFNNRCGHYDIDYQYLILEEEIEPIFCKMKNDVSFHEFISELAKHEAYGDLLNLFRKNSQIYEMMYEVDKFDALEHMKTFEIINYNKVLEGTEIYNELTSLLNLDKKTENPEESKCRDEDTEIKRKPITKVKKFNLKNNPYGLKKEYKDYFLSYKNYDNLTEDYIDDRKTSHDDFVKVFTTPHKKHTSKIYFLCETTLCSLLLHRLQKTIFTHLYQTEIAKSEKFYSNNDSSLSQSNISHSKKSTSIIIHDTVETTLNLIKSNKKS